MFNIEYAKELVWCNNEHSMFECIVKYAEFSEEMPAGVSLLDTYPHIKELWNNGISGKYGVIAEYTPPPLPVPPPLKMEASPDQPNVNGAQTL